MILKQLKPRIAINKAYLKIKPNRSNIELFKSNLIQLLDHSNTTESEEFHKNLVSDFLKKTYYDSKHFINTKGRNDLVIHLENNAKSNVGVIIEAKKPTNKAEMISHNKINVKAFQELVLYFLRERISQNNLEVKYLVATNINEWFIFDAAIFEKYFAQSKNLVKQFKDFEAGSLSGKTTDFFYKNIAEPFISEIKSEIEYTYFDIREYDKPLRNEDAKDDTKLIALFKLLSPEHLLKLPFANDSNSLDKRFYGELLHIIGLTETKDGGKKVIQRNKVGERNSGSLLENAIIQLDSLDKISRLEKPSLYGETNEDRLYNVGLELVITWVNRILFLKLLEAQLISYHKNDKSYAFLSLDKIHDYDDLNSLFFQVLAKRFEERNPDIINEFKNVPYLNSSLFEPTDLEHATVFISNLRDEKKLPIYSNSVLKNEAGKKLNEGINALEYLFKFLDAYDFSSEGSEEIKEDSKTLINASVLGLIFEKINGYKDGSFFTPGFITMYMCRETIRKAVVQKFNETKNWDCKDFDELHDKIEVKDREEANTIVNSIKICDPAVGSGHFLVSALNEMIAIKSDLKILQDRTGKRLKEYHVEVVNDELIVTDEDGSFFEYKPALDSLDALQRNESQRIQETLFHEKQTIIENCLFGVDINSNSVKICRLRLWIELLKSAYYKNETELETLPNIDINIKCGNSLVSRFAIDADLKEALKKSKWSIESYRIAVDTYRNAKSKEQKKEMERLIADIKSDFRSEISLTDPKAVKYRKVRDELFNLTSQTQLFDLGKKEQTAWNKKVTELTKEIKKLETEIEEIKANKIYENAFEWRFEFPEVLNDEGDFVGFDVVIGNPPYFTLSTLDYEMHNYLINSKFKTYSKSSDIYCLFYELGINILNNISTICFITSNRFCFTNYGIDLRKYLSEYNILQIINFNEVNVFENANVGSLIMLVEKSIPTKKEIKLLNFKENTLTKPVEELMIEKSKMINKDYYNENQWSFDDNDIQKIKSKIERKGISFSKWKDISINRGITTGLNKVFIISEEKKNEIIAEDPLSEEIIKPVLKGANIKRYSILEPKQYLIYTYTDVEINKYKGVFNYLNQFKAELEDVYEAKNNQKKWYELRKCAYYDKFFQTKLVWTRLSNVNAFSISVNSELSIDSSSFAVSKDAEYLSAILNSKVVLFYFKLGSVIWGKDGIKWFGNYFDNIPIPVISKDEQKPILKLVNKILSIKKENPEADTTEIENELDQLVYQLYELTEEEIQIIETTN